MSTEMRFLLAIVLMVAVLVLTNLLFPPVPPEEVEGPAAGDSVAGAPADTPAGAAGEDTGRASPAAPEGEAPAGPELVEAPGAGDPGEEVTREGGAREDPFGGRLTREPDSVALQPGEAPGEVADRITVEGPLYTYTFSPVGGRLVSARLPDFSSFVFDGPVELIRPDGSGALGVRFLVSGDTLDLRDLSFEVEPEGGLRLSEGGGPRSLHFTYRHPSHPFTYRVTYTFHPDQYVVDVSGEVSGVDAELVLTDLGTGLPFNEEREQDEVRASAYVVNHYRQGIRAERLNKVDEARVEEGPLLWAAFKSKYFLLAVLAGSEEDEEVYLGGALVRPVPGNENAVAVAVSQSVRSGGNYDFRLFMGPQEFARLSNLGDDLQNVNPYGWKFFRPIFRPFVGIIIAILTFFHENLKIGYGWVLILFGILMRVVLFPLNQKAMKSQMKNMAVQPLLQEIQAKYKDNPEKLQKEMMKLYKEHGFNPLGGCLPMLLPFPVLIALFFVFQNTIELRGVSFLWLPDLSAPDPFFILPVFLGVSMFLLQWVSMRSMPQSNPQMKMMMYVMPIMMVFIFFQLASGLNLYYATANIATLPQQIYIARERKKQQAKAPLKLDS